MFLEELNTPIKLAGLFRLFFKAKHSLPKLLGAKMEQQELNGTLFSTYVYLVK